MGFYQFVCFFSFLATALIALPYSSFAQEKPEQGEDGIITDGDRNYEIHMGTEHGNFMVNPQYESLTRQLMKMPAKFNYERYRALYSMSRYYDPMSEDAMRELSRIAFVISNSEDEKEIEKARSEYNEHLKKHLANISVVSMAKQFAMDDKRFGNPKFFERIRVNLFRSVRDFGDGKSVNTAYHVVTFAEETLLLSSLGYKIHGTTAMHSGMLYINAHAVEDLRTGRRYTIFVDITRPMSYIQERKEKEAEQLPAVKIR